MFPVPVFSIVISSFFVSPCFRETSNISLSRVNLLIPAPPPLLDAPPPAPPTASLGVSSAE